MMLSVGVPVVDEDSGVSVYLVFIIYQCMYM